MCIVSFSIPSLNMDQKREISDCINKLPAEKMCEVVQIIQESIPLVSYIYNNIRKIITMKNKNIQF